MIRDEIGDVLLNFRLLGLTIKEGEDAILALIAPELEKAKKYDEITIRCPLLLKDVVDRLATMTRIIVGESEVKGE